MWWTGERNVNGFIITSFCNDTQEFSYLCFYTYTSSSQSWVMWPPEYVEVVSYSTGRFFINVKMGQYLIDTVNYRQGRSSYCGGWGAAMASGCLSSLQMNLRNQSSQSPINVTCQILNAGRVTKERDLALHLWQGCLRHSKRRHQRALSTWAGPSGQIWSHFDPLRHNWRTRCTRRARSAREAPSSSRPPFHGNAADTHL